MKVIALNTDIDTESIRSNLDEVDSKWHVVDFNTALDLLETLENITKKISQLEIVANGSPRYLDGIQPTHSPRAREFGKRLKAVPKLTPDSKIFLNGCNTGCAVRGSSITRGIAQRVANAAGMTVSGTLGYIIGSHAVGNEKTVANDGVGDIYDGAVDALRDACWRPFSPIMAKEVPGEQEQGPELVEGIKSGQIKFAADFMREIQSAVISVMATDAIADAPRPRVAPDLVFSIPGQDGRPLTLELVGNGAVLREHGTQRRWRFPLGRRMLLAAAPLLDRDEDLEDDRPLDQGQR